MFKFLSTGKSHKLTSNTNKTEDLYLIEYSNGNIIFNIDSLGRLLT